MFERRKDVPGKLYVSGFNVHTITEDKLREKFSKHGEISNCLMIKDRDTKKLKGYAFITYADPENALKAKKALQRTSIDGRELTIDIAMQGISKQLEEKGMHSQDSGRGHGRPGHVRDIGRRRGRDFDDGFGRSRPRQDVHGERTRHGNRRPAVDDDTDYDPLSLDTYEEGHTNTYSKRTLDPYEQLERRERALDMELYGHPNPARQSLRRHFDPLMDDPTDQSNPYDSRADEFSNISRRRPGLLRKRPAFEDDVPILNSSSTHTRGGPGFYDDSKPQSSTEHFGSRGGGASAPEYGRSRNLSNQRQEYHHDDVGFRKRGALLERPGDRDAYPARRGFHGRANSGGRPTFEKRHSEDSLSAPIRGRTSDHSSVMRRPMKRNYGSDDDHGFPRTKTPYGGFPAKRGRGGGFSNNGAHTTTSRYSPRGRTNSSSGPPFRHFGTTTRGGTGNRFH